MLAHSRGHYFGDLNQNDQSERTSTLSLFHS